MYFLIKVGRKFYFYSIKDGEILKRVLNKKE